MATVIASLFGACLDTKCVASVTNQTKQITLAICLQYNTSLENYHIGLNATLGFYFSLEVLGGAQFKKKYHDLMI